MRVDAFLKQARLVKRRSLAKELCDDGAVLLNGRPARAGRDIEPGDRLTLRMWNRVLEVEIERLPERPPGKAESRRLYKLLSETYLDEGR